MQNGQPCGPVDEAAITALVGNGTLNGESMVWKEGMPSWVALKTVPELAGAQAAAGSAPPPPPSAAAATALADGETPDPADVEKNKIFAILAYVGLLFLVPLLAAPQSRFARYHTNQGVVLFLAVIICMVGSGILGVIPFVGCISALLMPAAALAGLVFMILGIVNAANGRCKPLPLIGQYKLIK